MIWKVPIPKSAHPTESISQKDIIPKRDWVFSGLHTQTIIAFAAFIAVLFSIIQFSISPVKENIKRIEAGQTKINERMDKNETEIKELKDGQKELKDGQKELKELILKSP